MTQYVCLLVSKDDSRRYVGITRHPKGRLQNHKRTKLWVDQMLILETFSDNDWKTIEKKHIAFWKQLGPLENKNDGGGGCLEHSEEARVKISVAQIGNTKTLGKKYQEETKAKMSAAKMGHAVSEETRAKLSAAAFAQWERKKVSI